MDNYLDKKRLNNYYLVLAQREANILQNYARQISSTHLKNLIPRLNFNNEIDKFIGAQIKQITAAKNERECKECLFNIREEKRFIEQQNTALRMGSAKVVVSTELVNKLDAWGYVINGIGILLAGGQIIAGLGITAASLTHANVVGVFAGAMLILHGSNGIEESINNIRSGRSDSAGYLKKGYIETAEFMGLDGRVGAMAYSTVDVGLSIYGLARMILKPDAWRLFRHMPSDYVRSIKNTSAPALALEGIGDTLSIKSGYESYSR